MTEQLPLITEATSDAIGLTEWFEGPPPYIGWWNTKRMDRPAAVQLRRRWWDGQRWSFPVIVGIEVDHATEDLKNWPADSQINDQIKWQGMTRPATAYPYTVPFLPHWRPDVLGRKLNGDAGTPA